MLHLASNLPGGSLRFNNRNLTGYCITNISIKHLFLFRYTGILDNFVLFELNITFSAPDVLGQSELQ